MISGRSRAFIGHAMAGENAYLPPCLGRTEIDLDSEGQPQLATVEDSMSIMRGSTGIANATVGTGIVRGLMLADDYDRIHYLIERACRPCGFDLGNCAAMTSTTPRSAV